MMLYHRVPQDIKSDSLMPLNKLKNLDNQLYLQYCEKYIGREALTENRIPYLDCLWNDVIHLSPIHPRKIVSALSKSGFKNMRTNKWFEICPKKNGFTNENTVIYHYKTPFVPLATQEEYEPFDLNKLHNISNLRDAVLEHYRLTRIEGKRPHMFHLVPHVLHQGIVRLEGLNVIDA